MIFFMIKFVYNNNVNAFIDISFFKINLNYFSRINFEKFSNFRIKSIFTKKHVIIFNKFIEIFQKHLIVTQKT